MFHQIEMTSTLFQSIVKEMQPFFGHHANEFIRRQCAHIRVEPETLTKEDVPSLAHWASTSARLILSTEKAKQIFEKIKSFGE